MTQEDKELLLKDLCGRLPYGVKCSYFDINVQNTTYGVLEGFEEKEIFVIDNLGLYAEDIKPYLFPISSMTEEQKEEYEEGLVYHDYTAGGWTIAKTFNDEYIIPYWFVDFCNKHNLDYRGLIEKGLAIDATNLNIY